MAKQQAAKKPDEQATDRVAERNEVRRIIRALEPTFHRVLPKLPGLSPERLAMIAITVIEDDDTGKLVQCTTGSLARALIHSAELGLEPGTASGHAYLIPYWNKEIGRYEAEFQVGVYGFVELARRSGDVLDVWADVIYEKDVYRVRRGDDPRLEHDPAWWLDADQRGKRIGAYACAEIRGAKRVSFELVREADVQRARASNRGASPAWDQWGDEMAKKVALKRARKLWPSARELAMAAEIDDHRHQLPENVQRALAEAVSTVLDGPKALGVGGLDRVVARKAAEPKSSPVAVGERIVEPDPEARKAAYDNGEVPPDQEPPEPGSNG